MMMSRWERSTWSLNVAYPSPRRHKGRSSSGRFYLSQCIESERMMRWSNVDISFEPQDHPNIELSDRNLTFVIKLPIRWHKVAKTLIDN
jgi:hypothetical protein